MITSFTGNYAFLSNFYPHGFTFEGEWYRTAEHAYQTQKTFNPYERDSIRLTISPGKAKRVGQHVTIRKDWEDIRLAIMHRILLAKFSSHRQLKYQLIETLDYKLIEGNTWGDTYWGAVEHGTEWVGANWLGRLLVLVRSELRLPTF